MNILVLKGSPHAHGSSNLLAAEFIRGAKEEGHAVTELDIPRMDVRGCTGCGGCAKTGRCVLPDDGAAVQQALLQTDLAVFVTPVYYFGMSSQLKAVIDRFHGYSSTLAARHLRAVLLAAAWDDTAYNFSFLRAHFQAVCDYLNFTIDGVVLGGGCGTLEMTRATDYPQQAYALGRSLPVQR